VRLHGARSLIPDPAGDHSPMVESDGIDGADSTMV
jgi:hypothetical protein